MHRVDSLDYAPRRRLARHGAEQLALIAQHRQLRQRVPAISDHHRQVRQHPPRQMTKISTVAADSRTSACWLANW